MSSFGLIIDNFVMNSEYLKLNLIFFRIPNVSVSMEEGGEELEISDDPHDCRRLDVNSIPVTVTMSKV